MGSSTRNGAVVGLILGGLVGFLVCVLEWPFPNYTHVGNAVLVEAARRLVSPGFSRALDAPIRLLGVYALLGAATGAIVGALGGAVSRALGRDPEWGTLSRRHGTLLAGGVLTAYLALAVVHFRLSGTATTVIVTLAAIVSFAASFPVAHFLSRIARREPAWTGIALIVVTAGLLVAEAASITAAQRSRGRNVVDIPLPGSNGSKVAMLCLDGTSWDLLDPLLDAGKLPNLARLVENGSRGNLRSTLPPIKSPSVWTSIATSRRAEDHRVFDFLSYAPSTGQWVPTTNRIRRVRTFWDVLAEMGVSIDLLSWYPSWPPDSIPGVMLTDRATFGNLPERVFPPDRERMLDSLITKVRGELPEARRRFTPYDPALDVAAEGDLARSQLRKSGIEVLDQTYLRDEVTRAFAEDCLRRGQPQCLVVYFRGIDSMQHKFRKFHGTVHDPLLTRLLYDVGEEEGKQLGGIIDRYAEYVDECVGGIVAGLEPGTTILVVSDHGHSYRNDSQVNLRPNALLVPLGWTILKDDRIDLGSSLLYGRQDPTNPEVMRIYVNVEGGAAEGGVVARRELDDVLRETRERLSGLRTRGGEPLFGKVSVGSSPGSPGSDGDLRCRFNREALGGTVEIGGSVVPVTEFAYPTPKSGNHRITGVFLLSGGDAAKGRRIRGADVYDVIPTLFRLLDVPLSLEWEGDPVEEAIAPSFRDLGEARWVRSYETPGERLSWEESVTTGADEAMMEELRALGYIQ